MGAAAGLRVERVRQSNSDGGDRGVTCRQENQLQSSELNRLKSQCCCRELAFIGLIRYKNDE